MTAGRREPAFYLLVTVAALALRLVDLGDRPFHHDESQDAYFSWLLAERGDYAYDPLLHGPLRFYLTAAVFLVAGDSDLTARLAPALMGTAMVPLAWLLRPLAGRVAAAATTVMLAAGPSFLYFSRFAREDIYVACLSLALLALTFRQLDRPTPWGPAAIGALLAASFATKETTFITVFVAGTFALVWLARDLRRHTPDLLARVRASGAEPLGWGIAAFVAVYVVLFTTFFTDPDHWDGLTEGLDYWLGQHDVGRGGEAWFFYGVVLAGVEWPVLALGAVGAVAAIRRPSPLRLFCVWAFVVSLVVYSWAGEKFAWLVLHPLLPLVVLAGVGVEAVWAARRTWRGRGGLVLAAVGAAYIGFASWSAGAVHRADPRELLVTTQSSEAVLEVRERVLETAVRVRDELGRSAVVVVDRGEGATFPWAWYFRDLPVVEYPDVATASTLPPGDVLLVTDAGRERLAGALGDYDARRFPFRVWWVRDYGAVTPATWARWLVERRPWSPTGGMPMWMLTRRGL